MLTDFEKFIQQQEDCECDCCCSWSQIAIAGKANWSSNKLLDPGPPALRERCFGAWEFNMIWQPTPDFSPGPGEFIARQNEGQETCFIQAETQTQETPAYFNTYRCERQEGTGPWEEIENVSGAIDVYGFSLLPAPDCEGNGLFQVNVAIPLSAMVCPSRGPYPVGYNFGTFGLGVALTLTDGHGEIDDVTINHTDPNFPNCSFSHFFDFLEVTLT